MWLFIRPVRTVQEPLEQSGFLNFPDQPGKSHPPDLPTNSSREFRNVGKSRFGCRKDFLFQLARKNDMFDAQEITEAVEKLLWIRYQVVENAHKELLGLEMLQISAEVCRIAAAVNQLINLFEGCLKVTVYMAHFDEVEIGRKGSLARLAQTDHQPR